MKQLRHNLGIPWLASLFLKTWARSKNENVLLMKICGEMNTVAVFRGRPITRIPSLVVANYLILDENVRIRQAPKIICRCALI